MDWPRLESNWWYLVGAVALLELVALVVLIYLRKLRSRTGVTGAHVSSVEIVPGLDPRWVLREIERVRSGEDLNEPMIKQLSAADRALFEVSLIDALSKWPREDQHRLRSALINYGYDEQCARRVMSEDVSDRVRACALLSLLRPQWRDPSGEPEHPADEGRELGRAAGRTSGPLGLE